MLLQTTTIALVLSPLFHPAQDMKPAPEDVEAIKGRLDTALLALIEKDADKFLSCCDPFYLDCFFADGTLVKGRKTIKETLLEHFAGRREGVKIELQVVPRSYRVLTPDVVTVDWPATITLPEAEEIVVNTMTTLRKTKGEWYITSYLESVPFEGIREKMTGK